MEITTKAIIKEVAENQPIEHVTIYEWKNGDTVVALELVANTGYAMYDVTQVTGVNPETGEPNAPTYFNSTLIPVDTPLTNYVAVVRTPDMDVVGDTHKPEVM